MFVQLSKFFHINFHFYLILLTRIAGVFYMIMMNNELVEIGYVSRTHGVHGDLIIKLINNDSKTLRKGLKIYLNSQSNIDSSFDVLNVRYGNNLIISLKGIASLEDAKFLIGTTVFVNKDSIASTLHQDEFLLNDLLGFEVLTNNGLKIGKITEFSSNGIQDIAHVKKPSGKFCDLLLIKPFILEIDYPLKTIIVDINGVVE